MELHPKEAFISALGAARKTVAFLVGSPFSSDMSGKGVPGITQMLDIIREVVLEEIPLGVTRYDKEVGGKTGTNAYQSAMGWLQANVHQDAVNTVIRRAVLKSCLDTSTVGNPEKPTCDGEPVKWFLPAGTRSLATLVTSSASRFSGPILTPNFDPLLSLAIKDAGGNPSRRVLDTDGSLPRDIDDEHDARYVVHFHGYWRDSDTLHTPTQLRSSRPKLKASLQRLLRKHVLVVVAYGGWDDAFTTALAELLHDDQAEIEVLWCFYESVSSVVKDQYKHLLDSVAPAITRGRFRCYGGIDCHTIFSDVALAASTSCSSIDTSIPPVTNGDKNHVNLLNATSLKEKSLDEDLVDRYLTKQLDDALKSFSSQPKVWVDPVISKSAEVALDAEAGAIVSISDLISAPESVIIKAPPQFGLTCLARYLAREAWRAKERSLWLYLDAKSLKPHLASIEEAETDLKLFGCVLQDYKCIILDSWTCHDKDSFKLLQKISTRYGNIPIIVMQTIDETQLLSPSANVPLEREFEVLYLWSLSRSHVRKVVADYIENKQMGDENTVTTKVISDLEVLNIHRTPLNCLTLLKVSEIDFDESPVNRAEMISRVLFLLFNVDELPTYKVRPDLKDCEYVLGYFCESMVRDGKYSFTRDHFLRVLLTCCKEKLIDLETHVVFDVLHTNNILVKRGSLFCFKSAFWIYYFAAQRMHHDQNFAAFIFEDMKYANFPEIIEFYTGSDRRREDALRVLIKDISATCDQVQTKCGLPDGLNPYRYVQWRPSEAMLEQMNREISDGVLGSNLPDSVKDQYSDRSYDRVRPYNQDIQNILAEYSLVFMMQTMKAGAKALRNSDYVDPDIKRKLLQEILRCWEQLLKVLLILLPFLAERGRATFEGTAFLLCGNFGDTTEKRIRSLLVQIPGIVVNLSKDDLFSPKMGPLLIDQLVKEDDELVKHILLLLMITQRPREWKAQVQAYIASKDKNSFYLMDVYQSLRAQYRYSYATPQTLIDIEYLIKMAAAKHAFGSKIPGIKMIKNVKDSVIPAREVSGDI